MNWTMPLQPGSESNSLRSLKKSSAPLSPGLPALANGHFRSMHLLPSLVCFSGKRIEVVSKNEVMGRLVEGQ